MKNEIKCPKCNQAKVKMIDHLPLELNTILFDDELYATFKCLQTECNEVFNKMLKIVVAENN